MEQSREERMREEVEKILALEGDHEHKEALQELISKAQKKEDESFIVKYGLNDWKFAVPIGIILGIPAIHNEVIVLDAETQLLGCFMFFVASLYTMAGDMIGKSLDEYGQQVYNEMKSVDDAILQKITESFNANKSALSLEEDFKSLNMLRDDIAVAQADLLNHQAQHQYHDAIVKKLESLSALEDAATAAMKSRMLTSVKNEVIQTYQKDKKIQDEALAHAMDILSGGAKKKMGKDVVGNVFKTAVKNYASAYAKQPEGSDPILKQLEEDMKAVMTPPTVEGKGGNVYVTHPLP